MRQERKARSRRGARWTTLAVALCLVLGTAQAAVAAPVNETVTFSVIPPVGGTGAGTTGSARLTCGWHSSCVSPYPSGTGLDWVNGNDSTVRTVNIRAKVTTSFAASASNLVRAKVYGRSIYNGCHEIVAEIYFTKGTTSTSDDVHAVNLHWLHASASSSKTVSFGGSKLGSVGGTSVGTMSNDSAGGCSWTGYHVHSYHTTVDGRAVTTNTAQIPKAAGPCFINEGGACNYFANGSDKWSPPSGLWERKVSYSYCVANCLI